MKTFSLNSPNFQDNIFPIYPTYIENKFVVLKYNFSGPNGIYLLEFSNNNNIKYVQT